LRFDCSPWPQRFLIRYTPQRLELETIKSESQSDSPKLTAAVNIGLTELLFTEKVNRDTAKINSISAKVNIAAAKVNSKIC
jgi:hypothetical protein